MKLWHRYYVYIVECSDGFYYTGITNNLNKRIAEHNEGKNTGCFTYKRRPVLLRFYEVFIDVTQARQRETQLKGWSRKKKEALLNEAFGTLKELAKSKRPPHDPSTSSGRQPHGRQ